MYKQSIQGCNLDVECNNIEMIVTLRDPEGISEGCDYENFYISSNPDENSVPDNLNDSCKRTESDETNESLTIILKDWLVWQMKQKC